MSSSIEKELKVLLSPSDFNKLFQYFKLNPSDYLYQSNTYYDTKEQQLRNNNAALRLRNFVDNSEWTIKRVVQTNVSTELTQVNEYPIINPPSHLTTEILGLDLTKALNSMAIPLEDLVQTYQITTHRWNILTEYGEYALDKSKYFNTSDYELELETDNLNLAQVRLEQLLTMLSIPYKVAEKKIARAADYRKKYINNQDIRN